MEELAGEVQERKQENVEPLVARKQNKQMEQRQNDESLGDTETLKNVELLRRELGRHKTQ